MTDTLLQSNGTTGPTNPPGIDLAAREAINQLGWKVDQALAEAHRIPSLEDARSACNEAGIHEARKNLSGSVADIISALATKRAADDELRILSEAVDSALLEAEWELDGRFVTEGNKTFLLIVGETDDQVDRRAMTADERKTWKRDNALKHPTVAAAMAARRVGEAQAAEARDGVVVAERWHTSCKYALNAAVAQLETLRTALTVNGAAR